MNFEAMKERYPLQSGAYRRYLRVIVPQLDIERLDTGLLVGHERHVVRTPITGDFSTVLRYKSTEAAVSSFEARGDDMVLQQLQGARSKVSWRVATGMRWDDFLMSEAIAVATLPESGVRRIGMPQPIDIENIDGARSEQALERYKAFIVHAHLRWSQQDQLFVRDLK